MSRLCVGISATFFLVACTAENPFYRASDGGDGGGNGEAFDLLLHDGAVDSASTPPDLAKGSSCAGPSVRACSATGSESCASGVLTPDRTCPMASLCMSGYCQPPPSKMYPVGASCAFNNKASESSCHIGFNTSSCQPFLDPMDPSGDVHWVCDVPIGAGDSGDACSNGATCRSGFCGSNGTCFRACDSNIACGVTVPSTLKCDNVTITVEGTQISAKSCVPK